MLKPHPKGPRIYRNLFEVHSMNDHKKGDRPDGPQGIDLTSFTGRYPSPGAGFVLPSGFSRRLNAAGLPALRAPSFANHPLDVVGTNPAILTAKV